MRAGGHELHLTALDQSLLYLLAANAGRVMTRDEILDNLWGVDFMAESNVVDRHIRNADGTGFSASIVDAALFVIHNHRALMAAGEASAVEVAEAHLDRIAAVDGAVKAFLHVDRELVLEQARRVDARRAAGEPTTAERCGPQAPGPSRKSRLPGSVEDPVKTEATPIGVVEAKRRV